MSERRAVNVERRASDRQGAAMSTTVIARCIGCGTKREIKAGKIAPGDHPMCDCGMPMVADKAVHQSAKQTANPAAAWPFPPGRKAQP